jgi:hypothetical protein
VPLVGALFTTDWENATGQTPKHMMIANKKRLGMQDAQFMIYQADTNQ